ncbi:MAG: hypothetical protein ACRC0Y_12895 [Fusobacteriaceae bacterium]
MELKDPFLMKIGEDEKKITELSLTKEKFTASVIIKSEKEFLITGGVFPSGSMEDSRAYLLCVAAKMLGFRTEDLEDKLSGEDFIAVTDVVKGFYGGTGLNALLQTLLEKQ